MVAGALAGSAAGVKYLGLYFVPAAAIFACAPADAAAPTGGARSRWPQVPRRLAVYAIAVVVAMTPSYGRLLAHTGNPLFPFYPELFGSSPWAAQQFLGRRGVDRLASAATVLWDVTFRRERVGGLPPFSPAIAFGLPIVLLGLRRRRALAWIAGLTAGYLAIAPVHGHYLLAIAPIWCVAIGASGAVLLDGSRHGPLGASRRFHHGVLVAVAFLLASWGGWYAIDRAVRLGPPPVTAADRDRLLTSQRPLYPAVQFLNRTAPGATVYSVGAENMVDDRVGPLLGDHNGPVSHATMQARVVAGTGVAVALDGIGATWLLLREDGSVWNMWAPADPRLALAYRDAHASVYRVIPAAPAARDSVARPRPD